jgi:hypothetical protein
VDPDRHRVDDTAGSEALDDAAMRERPEQPKQGELMDRRDTNPSANVPAAETDEPRGDRGQGDKTWTPDSGEQGISNRADDQNEVDEEGDSETDHESQDEGEEVGE